MITSLSNWRQRLFKNRPIIGCVFNETHLCLVQIQFQNGSIRIGPWIYQPYSPLDLAKQLEAALTQGQFATKAICVSLSNYLIEIVEVSGDQPPNELTIAQTLAAQTNYPDLTVLATAMIENQSDGPLLICNKTNVHHYLDLVSKTQGKLVALDWQPLAMLRLIWFIGLIILSFPLFRFPLLGIINTYQAIHFETLGTAINGLYYVGN
jgi:hypothetical protein